MRKLTFMEQNALNALARVGHYCPGDVHGRWPQVLRSALDKLVKKGRVAVEMTDDGPRYTLTAQGEADAA